MNEYTVKQTASESSTGFASIELGVSVEPNFIIPNPQDTVNQLCEEISAIAEHIQELADMACLVDFGRYMVNLASIANLQSKREVLELELNKWIALGYRYKGAK